ncbi:MAG: thermostable hemolysin [Polyangiaceae bacterium]
MVPRPHAFLAGCIPGPCGGSEVVACAGLTFASTRPFFSERYLDEPVETAIEKRIGSRPQREQIVEIGSLASGVPGLGSEIIRFTPVFVWSLGMQYILCTSTASLSLALQRLHIPFTALGSAEAERLDPSERGRWGGYYESGPRVGVIPLNKIGTLFEHATGRYSFADSGATLLTGAQQVFAQGEQLDASH